MEDLEIALMLLEELEKHHTRTKVTKGFGVGHPRFAKKLPRVVLGKGPYDVDDEDQEAERPAKPERVQVSKAFKK